MYDGNLSTGSSCGFGKKTTVTFDEPISVNKIKTYLLGAGGANLAFYSNGSTVRNIKIGVKNTDYININLSDIDKIEFSNSSWSYQIMELEVYSDEYFRLPIESLSATVSFDHVILSWVNPNSIDFELVEVYENGEFKKNVYTPLNTTKIDGLKPNTEYTFKAIAVYKDGGKSIERSITVTTEDIPEDLEVEVINLKAVTKHDRVDLSWAISNSVILKHVNIYREEIKETKKGFSLFGKSVEAATKTKIFETNGTYFNDLTVQPESKYEYTLTTESTLGIESEGVTITAVTKAAPQQEIIDGGYVPDENGDYLFTWKEPTKGKVKILIDGKEYKTVEAAAKQILIPKEHMVYDIFNNPKVVLVPIDETGKEGTPTTPPNKGETNIGDIKVPFTVTDVVKVGMSLIGLIAAFILLGLAFRFVPKFIKMVYESLRNNRAKDGSEREPRRRREV